MPRKVARTPDAREPRTHPRWALVAERWNVEQLGAPGEPLEPGEVFEYVRAIFSSIAQATGPRVDGAVSRILEDWCRRLPRAMARTVRLRIAGRRHSYVLGPDGVTRTPLRQDLILRAHRFAAELEREREDRSTRLVASRRARALDENPKAAEVMRLILGRSLSDHAVAKRLHLDRATVRRIREAAGITPQQVRDRRDGLL